MPRSCCHVQLMHAVWSSYRHTDTHVHADINFIAWHAKLGVVMHFDSIGNQDTTNSINHKLWNIKHTTLLRTIPLKVWTSSLGTLPGKSWVMGSSQQKAVEQAFLQSGLQLVEFVSFLQVYSWQKAVVELSYKEFPIKSQLVYSMPSFLPDRCMSSWHITSRNRRRQSSIHVSRCWHAGECLVTAIAFLLLQCKAIVPLAISTFWAINADPSPNNQLPIEADN